MIYNTFNILNLIYTAPVIQTFRDDSLSLLFFASLPNISLRLLPISSNSIMVVCASIVPIIIFFSPLGGTFAVEYTFAIASMSALDFD